MCYHPKFIWLFLHKSPCGFLWLSNLDKIKINLAFFVGGRVKVKGGKCLLVVLSKHSGASPCDIEGGGGDILQTRIVKILVFPRCLLSISLGNMHNFNFSKFSNKILLIKGRKYINKAMYIAL